MRITLLNTHDIIGGAERCSYDLARRLHQRGDTIRLLVRKKLGSDDFVTELPLPRWDRRWRSFCFESIGLTDTTLITPLLIALNGTPFREADLFNLHNLHSAYWNIWTLPILARRAPLVLTLHDEWLFTGDCTYTYDCDRWQRSCGECPQACWPEAADRYAIGGSDATRVNLLLKRRCLQMLPEQRVTIVTPSEWLLRRTQKAPHLAGFAFQQIENGIDLDAFRPGDRRSARTELGLSEESFLLLSSVSDVHHGRKNFSLLADLLSSSAWPPGCILVCAGETEEQTQVLSGLPVKFLGYLSAERMAKALVACDASLRIPEGDNFPYSVLESLACGCPVVASSVGGIPEMVDDGVTGWILPDKPNLWDLARVLRQVVETPPERLQYMRSEARAQAERRFSMNRFVDRYRALFERCLSPH